MKRLRYVLGWLLVRPRRWLFRNMVFNSYLQLTVSPLWPGASIRNWSWPNPHWWLLYKTVFKFCKWLNYEAWRPLCDWTGGGRRTYPLLARIIHRIGQTTAGYAISGGECHHCASKEGCQVDLANDESGEMFRLIKSWTSSSENGTDHRFSGTTICPKCGFEEYYEDGSL